MHKTNQKKSKPEDHNTRKGRRIRRGTSQIYPMKKKKKLLDDSTGVPDTSSVETTTKGGQDDDCNDINQRQRIITFGNFYPHRSYVEPLLPRYSSPLEFSIQNLSFHESTLTQMIETNSFELILSEMSQLDGVTRPLLIICLGMNHFRDKRDNNEIISSIIGLHERAHAVGIQTIALEVPPNVATEDTEVESDLWGLATTEEENEEARRIDVNNRVRYWAEGKQAITNMICFVPFPSPSCDTPGTDITSTSPHATSSSSSTTNNSSRSTTAASTSDLGAFKGQHDNLYLFDN